MKIALIVYGIGAFIWFIVQTYANYKEKYMLEKIFTKVTIKWGQVILKTIFWPVHILIVIIEKIVKISNQ